MIKTTLTISVVFFALVGAILISIPFISSLAPNEKQINELPRANVSELKAGNFLVVNGPRYRAFLLKNEKGHLKIFSVPFFEDKYRMPDPTWDRAWIPCDKFGPEAVGTELVENGKFRCFDKSDEDGSQWKFQLEWSFDGETQQKPYGDMLVPRYEIRGNTIYFG